MQRRHFILIADTIGNLDLNGPRHEHVINEFVAALRPTNANFQTGRFVERCRKVREDKKTIEKARKDCNEGKIEFEEFTKICNKRYR